MRLGENIDLVTWVSRTARHRNRELSPESFYPGTSDLFYKDANIRPPLAQC